MQKIYQSSALPRRGSQKPRRTYSTAKMSRTRRDILLQMTANGESMQLRIQPAKEYEDTLKPIRATR